MTRRPPGSKQTVRESLEQVCKTIGRKPKELENEPQLPEEFGYLWGWFNELWHPFDFLGFKEIAAWAEVKHISLLDWESSLLITIDRLYRKVMSNGK